MALYSPGGLNLADTTAPLILGYNNTGSTDVVFNVSSSGDLVVTPDGGDVSIVGTLAAGAISSGFGAIDIGSSQIDCGNFLSVGDVTLAATKKLYLDGGGNTYIRESAADTIMLTTNGTDRWKVNANGHLLAEGDNNYDIGGSGANRPREIYAGTTITAPSFVGALTGNASGTAATVTGAAQSAITSVGTLTSLAVGNITSTGVLSIGANPSAYGDIRLKKDFIIATRNNANDANKVFISENVMTGNDTLDIGDNGKWAAIRFHVSTLNVMELTSSAINLNKAVTTSGAATVGGNLVVSGVGPNAYGGGVITYVQHHFAGAFTSSGASTTGTSVLLNTVLTGAAADTGSLVSMRLAAGITTQTATESIGYIAQLAVEKPAITDNLTGDITVAASVYIKDAPTAGETNAALYVAAGTTIINGDIDMSGGGDFYLANAKKLYLDSGGDSYLWHSSSNNVVLHVGGQDCYTQTATATTFAKATTFSSTLDVTGNLSVNPGVMAIGSTANAAVALNITSNDMAGVNQYGINLNPTFTSDATTTGWGLRINAGTDNASFTQANMYGINVLNATQGAGSTITNLYGLKIESQTAGGTNYAIHTGTGAVSLGDSLTVSGSVIANANTNAIGGAVDASSQLHLRGSLDFSGINSSAQSFQMVTNLIPKNGYNGYGMLVAPTFTEGSAGDHVILATARFNALTTSAGSATISNTSTVYIAGAATATVSGTNYALWVDAGTTRLDGLTYVSTGAGVVPTLDGTTSLVVQRNQSTGADCRLTILAGNDAQAVLNFADAEDEDPGAIIYSHTSSYMGFRTGGTERWRFDDAGNFRSVADGSYDIGGDSAGRPRGVYAKNFLGIGDNASSAGMIRFPKHFGIFCRNPENDGNRHVIGENQLVGEDILDIGDNTPGTWTDIQLHAGGYQTMILTAALISLRTSVTMINASISMTALPTSDPSVAGRLWNDSNTVKISAG